MTNLSKDKVESMLTDGHGMSFGLNRIMKSMEGLPSFTIIDRGRSSEHMFAGEIKRNPGQDMRIFYIDRMIKSIGMEGQPSFTMFAELKLANPASKFKKERSNK